jgi:pimeloyl-ACP methyl ester carboxylesterase
MLARLLRRIYLFQLTCGAVLGSYFAPQAAQGGTGPLALLWIAASAVLLPLLIQFLVISSAMIRSRSGGSWLAWLMAYGGEFKAALRVFLLRQPWPHRQNGVQLPLPGATAGCIASGLPVLLVHGFICNHRVWDDVALALREAGHPVLAVDLEPLFTSIDDYAPVIERAVTQLLAQTGAGQLALVGHSMGGLVIRAWLRTQRDNRLDRVVRIVTLGTPHQGTRMLEAGLTANAKQMMWHSDWLQSLAAGESPTQRARMHLALTRQDNVVFPQREQVLAGAHVTEFEGMGHLEMCLDRGVITWVCRQLQAV